jgi:sodium/potassium-transporting ATPase subunit alpha
LIKKEINRLIMVMAFVAMVLGTVFFILAKLSGYSWVIITYYYYCKYLDYYFKKVESVIFFIGIVVANVPEGLLPQITVALTLTAQRMLAKGVLVLIYTNLIDLK